MSMIMLWVPTDAASAERVRAMDPDDFYEWLDEKGDRDSFDVDKAWHAIHFTLTGNAWTPDGPLGSVVLGGAPFGEDGGYGPPRWLAPDAVVAAAGALADLPPDRFVERLDFPALQANDIYPSMWDRDPESEEFVDYLRHGYETIHEKFTAAAVAGRGFVILLT